MSGARYLILAEGRFGPESSKTANSAIRYLPERVAAVVDSRLAGSTAGEVLGFGGDIPVVANFAEGVRHRPDALLIGIAPRGGRLPEEWRAALRAVLENGMDIVSGLHSHLADDPELSALARASGTRIHDLRRPPDDLPVATGRAREVAALTVLTVGTDCNLGKMTAALEIRAALREQGVRTGFAATGQTGILIEGRGIAVDAVAADFIAGAAERLVLDSAADNDVVLVEGQGSLVHPGYSGVTLGLLHGSMPDTMILCHQPSRRTPYSTGGGYEWMRLPGVAEMVEISERAIAPLRESRVIGIALNTYDLSDAAAREAVERTAAETGLPVTDPVRWDAEPLAEAVMEAQRGKAAR